MFNILKLAQAKTEIETLKDRILRRDDDIIRLENEIKKMSLEKADAIKADVNSSSFIIDWDNMDAFSVERMGDNSCAYTVIGYYMTDENNVKHIHEWKFYCSHEQHEKLAEEFKNGTPKENNSTVR